jgi:transcriptional regulator GlxA family with amidase domain
VVLAAVCGGVFILARSIDQIAASVGYDDVGGFRRVFRKIVVLAPSEYRQRFCRITRKL